MIYQFKDLSENLFVLNTATMRWGIASTILSAPSVVAATDKENNLAQYVFSKEGDMIPQGAGGFTLNGRQPKDGVSSVGIMAVPFEDTLVLYLKANAPVKDGSFVSAPITQVKYKIREYRPEEKKVSIGEEKIESIA